MKPFTDGLPCLRLEEAHKMIGFGEAEPVGDSLGRTFLSYDMVFYLIDQPMFQQLVGRHPKAGFHGIVQCHTAYAKRIGIVRDPLFAHDILFKHLLETIRHTVVHFYRRQVICFCICAVKLRKQIVKQRAENRLDIGEWAVQFLADFIKHIKVSAHPFPVDLHDRRDGSLVAVMQPICKILVGEEIEQEILLEYKEAEAVAWGGEPEAVPLVWRYESHAVGGNLHLAVIDPHPTSLFCEEKNLEKVSGVNPAAEEIFLKPTTPVCIDEEIDPALRLVETDVLYLCVYMCHIDKTLTWAYIAVYSHILILHYQNGMVCFLFGSGSDAFR